MSGFNVGARSFNPTAVWVPGAGLISSAPAPQPQAAPSTQPPKEETLTQNDSWEDEERKTEVAAEVQEQVEKLEVKDEQPAAPEIEEEAKEVPVEEECKDTKEPEKEEEVVAVEQPKKEVKEEEEEEEPEPDMLTHMSLFFMGHVDVGKSTICGNILRLTGMVNPRVIEKYEREAREANRSSWYLAYVMDTNEEERQKGKTVDLGRAYFETEKRRYTILDAPGHKAYVPNMIQGAVQADVGVLVISGKTGEFESGFEKNGQTREHAILARTLGIKRLIIAINKLDEVNWDKERFDQIVNSIGNFLRKELGYGRTDICFVPLSGQSGANLLEPVSKEECPWWDGKSLIQTFDEQPEPERSGTNVLRMPISDKFKDMGLVYLYGRIESGSIAKGQEIVIMPNKTLVKVSGLAVKSKEEDEREIKRARTGDSVRISISNLEESLVQVGFIVCSPSNPVDVVSDIVAQIQIKELPGAQIFTAGILAIMHIHTAQVECKIMKLLAEINPRTREIKKKHPHFVTVGSAVTVRIHIMQPICAECFVDYPQLGRFTLRDKGKTIAVGRVEKLLKPKPK